MLNEPAGKIAQIVVQYTAKHIVRAWADEGEDSDQVIDKVRLLRAGPACIIDMIQ